MANAEQNLSKLEKGLGYTFQNKDLLREALTHRSYLNENPGWKLPQNERLEFLGDAVLELIVTDELFKRFPGYQEGKLTPIRAALVNYQMLATIASELSMHDYLLLSRGETKDTGKGREVILANVFEAIVGAMSLDGGYEVAKKFVLEAVLTKLDTVMKEQLFRDPKSELQEKIQAGSKTTPTYRVLSESGPDHSKVFEVGVYSGERLLGNGKGASKQEAEVEAAREALSRL